MDHKDFNGINQLFLEMQFRDTESMQPPVSRQIKVADMKRDPSVSTPTWDGVVDPAKGNMLNSFSVDEEELDQAGKLKKLVQKELDAVPKNMSYARRVLDKLLKQIDSL